MTLLATAKSLSESNQQAHTMALTVKLKVVGDGGFCPWRGLHLINGAIPLAFATHPRFFLAAAEVIVLLTSANKLNRCALSLER